MAPAKKRRLPRRLDARPDTLDFRDLMFTATLVEVPTEIPLANYLKLKPPILDQKQEGSCTGFGLATVANFLLRDRKVKPSNDCVSPHMFYNLARRYDEWPGENYEGSSARGAMKGWQKHGACHEKLWPRGGEAENPEGWASRWEDARIRPLGAYFRVNHRDLVAMHSAIAEVKVLYATASVHNGWDKVKGGLIPWDKNVNKMTGGHAFALVGYDDRGFWVQNSWGRSWGQGGFALISYDDWLQNGTDVWVARLGAPVMLRSPGAAIAGISISSGGSRAYVYEQLRPHVISLGNDGCVRDGGTYGNTPAEVDSIVKDTFPRMTAGWNPRHLVLYAHGGLVAEESAIQRVADYRQALLDAKVYPLAFIWKTDYWTTLTNILQDALRRRRPEGFLDSAKDFMLDRLDDALEPLARFFTGKAAWDEMKENAKRASEAGPGGDPFHKDAGGAARVAARFRELFVPGALSGPRPKVHLIAHSAGSIFMAYMLDLLTKPSDARPPVTIESCTLWAPACTIDLFHQRYAPAIAEGRISRMTLFTMSDDAERDDNCGGIYHKSLLYLVSNAFEKKVRIPLLTRDSAGQPILGMAKALERDAGIQRLLKRKQIEWIRSPNQAVMGSPDASRSQHHGDFDDDEATVKATLARMLGRGQANAKVSFGRTSEGKRVQREELMQAARNG